MSRTKKAPPIYRSVSPVSPWESRLHKRRFEQHVYFIQSVHGGPIKIGIAKDVHSRLQTLSYTSPIPLRVLLVLRNVGQEAEYALHQKFNEHRLHYEWFNNAEPLIIWMMDALGFAPEYFSETEIAGFAHEARRRYDTPEYPLDNPVARAYHRIEQKARGIFGQLSPDWSRRLHDPVLKLSWLQEWLSVGLADLALLIESGYVRVHRRDGFPWGLCITPSGLDELQIKLQYLAAQGGEE